jgi:signal peptidase I
MKRRRWLLYLLLLLVPVSGCDSGDRVLVAKFLSDSNLLPLERYDVVVFKYPQSPIENGTPKNYIKRLLGLPGELIAIFFGRLYRYEPPPQPAVSEEEWQQLISTSGKDPLELWRMPPKNTPTAQKLWNQGSFKILRKPPGVMLALSRPVYDNDHPAADVNGILPERWAPQGTSGWKADAPNGFKIDGTAGGENWLRYRHILRPVDWPPKQVPDPTEPGNKVSRKFVPNPDYQATLNGIKTRKHWPQLITDFMGYNTYEIAGERHSIPDPNWVGDLMLECRLNVDEPKGEFWMELSKGIERFQARFNLQTGVCTLYRIVREGGKQKAIELKDARADTRVKAPGEYVIRFANYDDRLTVWVNRDLPFGDGFTYEPVPLNQVGPDTESNEGVSNLDDIHNNDLQPASFCSVGAPVRVHAIKLLRDTYYTGFDLNGMMVVDHDPNQIRGEDWSHPDKWGPLRKLEPKTIYVYPGHYLCLGDNSQESSDSRQWGLVPERLMLGRALLIYFPVGRAGRIK